ncbi:HNH endonuclease [Sporosarcina psychrophila]|uniref:HNH endonuclease n=1 Tax=Sporosarcina psychrophila TaxID=1476 RepID=UPI003395624D
MLLKWRCISEKRIYLWMNLIRHCWKCNMNKFCQKCHKLKNRCECSKQKRALTDSQESHPSRTYFWRVKLRPKILERDDCHCVRCRIKFNILKTDDLQVHHICSWRDYPHLAYDESNLITVCADCNKTLGNRNELDFEYTIPDEITSFSL